MKAVIFDIDWVVIKSSVYKKEIKEKIYKKYNLYDIPWVKDILTLWLNRKKVIEKIYELKDFDKDALLKELNYENSLLENNPVENTNVINFIKNNFDKYIFFSNTSLSLDCLNRIISKLPLISKFKELLTFDNWTKLENVNYILQKYNLNPKEVLFIDDNINHIDNVKPTWVNTLHFTDYDIDIEKEIEKY